jgi:poly-gamma-glutamate synthesis protein (capsule biosynthesis protein)
MNKKRLVVLTVMCLIVFNFSFAMSIEGASIRKRKTLFQKIDFFDIMRIEEMKKDLKEKKVQKANIVFTGDFGVGSPYGRKLGFDDVFREEGAKYFFEDLKTITENIDGYFINLENPFTDSTDYTKKIWTYKAHSLDYLDILTENKVKWANVMNNHSHDYKQQGLNDTIALLDEKGILSVGTNITKGTSSDNEIPNVQMERREIIEINGIKIGVVGYVSYYQNMIPNWKVKEDVEYLKANADYVVINMHWGNCYTQKISTLQRTRARKFAEFGPDLIIGNHPHVLQEIEEYKDTTIYYSLGNFIFAHKGTANDTNGVLVELELTKKDGKIEENIINIPINWIGHSYQNKYKPYIETNQNQIKNIERKLKTTIDFNLESYIENKK